MRTGRWDEVVEDAHRGDVVAHDQECRMERFIEPDTGCTHYRLAIACQRGTVCIHATQATVRALRRALVDDGTVFAVDIED